MLRATPPKWARFTAMTGLAIMVVMGAAACSKKEERKVATQVAAKVGGEEISVHQINQMLSRTDGANASPEAKASLQRAALERLIDQQIAINEAVSKKLERTPEVVAQIEAARREVIARAYVAQLTQGVQKPTEAEMKAYFQEHPQLFSDRRIFNVQEIVVPQAAGPEVIEQVRNLVKDAKSIEAIGEYLRSKDVKFGAGAATRTAEQIPLEVLAKLHALKDGQMMVLDGRAAITVLRVAATRSAPVTEEVALPRIQQFLLNQRASQLVAANLKGLRSKTEVTYMGEFAKYAEMPANAASGAPFTPEISALPLTDGSDDDKARAAIQKGLAGLK